MGVVNIIWANDMWRDQEKIKSQPHGKWPLVWSTPESGPRAHIWRPSLLSSLLVLSASHWIHCPLVFLWPWFSPLNYYFHFYFIYTYKNVAPMKLNLVVALNHIPPWWVMICLPCCYDRIYDKVTSEGFILPHSSRTQSVMEAEACGCCFHSQEAGRQRYPYPAFFLYIESGSEARGAVLLMFRGWVFPSQSILETPLWTCSEVCFHNDPKSSQADNQY